MKKTLNKNKKKTMKSIIVGREIAKDSNIKGYTNMEDLKKSLKD